MESGIYQIRNLINGNVYIGSTKNFEWRKREHFRKLELGIHVNDHLQYAYNFYGKENFVYERIEEVLIGKLREQEQYWIDEFGKRQDIILYNICIEVSGSFKRYEYDIRKEDLIDYKEKGLSNHKIAKIYNCHPDVIQDRLRQYDVKFKKSSKTKKYDISVSTVSNLRNAGLSYKEIAKAFGCSEWYIMNLLKIVPSYGNTWA